MNKLQEIKYEVQCIFGSTWENVWHETEDGGEVSTIFDTISEARAELEEFISDAEEAGMDEQKENYRIVRITKDVVESYHE